MPDERYFDIIDSHGYAIEGLSNPDTASKADKHFDNLETIRLIGSCTLDDTKSDEKTEDLKLLPPLKGNFHSPLGH